ncbi:MAG: DUF1924 domain-containing protein [Pseudomonadales bacterium]|nr:DUF1924 domain-containing protein [Pseudomonadales bacterium]
MLRKIASTLIIFFLIPQWVYAESAAKELQSLYATQGADAYSAKTGGSKWKREVASKNGDNRSCSTCHTADLRQSGKHIKTKKVIQPMAFSVNKDRYTKTKKIEKWLKRNCKWTWGRECTAQEKGDFLEYLLAQ